MRTSYFDNPAISRGTLVKFKTSSKSGAKALKEEKKDTPAMNFGRAFHAFMEFESEEEFFKTTLVYDETKRPEPEKTFASKANKEWNAEILNTSKDVITVEQYKTIKAMKESVKSTQFYKRAFAGGGDIQYERAFYTNIEGVDYKALTDVSIEYPDRLICIDWKTTAAELDSENEQAVKREIYKYDLQIQEAHYRNVIQATTDKEVIFVFFFVESHGANECLPVVIGGGSDIMIDGEYRWNRCRANYKKYIEGSIEGIDTNLNNGFLTL